MSEQATPDEIDYVKPDKALIELAVGALAVAERTGLRVVTAESCTGGFIAAVLSEAPGAAEYFEGAFVCYTKDNKCTALGVEPSLIDRYSAVSAEVAKAMAEGALDRSSASVAIAVTGVAGPDRDEDGNPVGLVYLACSKHGAKTVCIERQFGDQGRSRIRYLAATEALALLAQAASGNWDFTGFPRSHPRSRRCLTIERFHRHPKAQVPKGNDRIPRLTAALGSGLLLTKSPFSPHPIRSWLWKLVKW